MADSAAIDMHFLIGFAISSDVEQHRWERRWYGCGRKQDSTDEISRAWMAACGDRSDVPQDWQTGVAALNHAMTVANRMCSEARTIHADEKYSIPERHRMADQRTAYLALPFLDTLEKTQAIYARDLKHLHEKLDAPSGEFSELALTDARVKLSGLKPEQLFAAVRRSVDRGQMALRTEPIALRAERQTVRLVAIGAGDSGMIHATLNERAIFEHLASKTPRAASVFKVPVMR